ncbi:MAG: molybdenum cofactor biosynthesis protein [Myxococcales bacterium]|nr:molybdenum cofactor biosynthesis protein [Myxococcales bacterium]
MDLICNIAVLAIAEDPTTADLATVKVVADRLTAAGHRIAAREIVKDTEEAIRQQLSRWIADPKIDVVIASGGIESESAHAALAPLITQTVPGFTDLFRWLAYQDLGPGAMLSNAEAAQCTRTFVFVLPAAVGAVGAAMDKLIVPQLDSATKPKNLVTQIARFRAEQAMPPLPKLPVTEGDGSTAPAAKRGRASLARGNPGGVKPIIPAIPPPPVRTAIPESITSEKTVTGSGVAPKRPATPLPIKVEPPIRPSHSKHESPLALAKPEPMKREHAIGSTPITPDSVKSERAKSEPVKREPAKSEPVKREPPITGSPAPEQVKRAPIEATPEPPSGSMSAKPEPAKPESSPSGDSAASRSARQVSRYVRPPDDPPTKPIDVAKLERQIALSAADHDAPTRPIDLAGLLPRLPPGADEFLDVTDDQVETETQPVLLPLTTSIDEQPQRNPRAETPAKPVTILPRAAAAAAASALVDASDPAPAVSQTTQVGHAPAKPMSAPPVATPNAPPASVATAKPIPPAVPATAPPAAPTVAGPPPRVPRAQAQVTTRVRPIPLGRPSGTTTNDLPRGELAYPVLRRSNKVLVLVIGAIVLAAASFVAVVKFFPDNAAKPTPVRTAEREPAPTPVVIPPAPVQVDAAVDKPEIVMEAPDPAPPDAREPEPRPVAKAPARPRADKPVPKPPASPTPRVAEPAEPIAKAPEPAPAPPPVPVAADCDEVSCVLEHYARPCCQRYRPAETGFTPRSTVPDEITRPMVIAGVQKVKPVVIACGEKTAAKGTVKLAISVGADGHVREVSVSESPDPALGECVASAMRKTTFGKSVNGGSFTYPFAF